MLQILLITLAIVIS